MRASRVAHADALQFIARSVSTREDFGEAERFLRKRRKAHGARVSSAKLSMRRACAAPTSQRKIRSRPRACTSLVRRIRAMKFFLHRRALKARRTMESMRTRANRREVIRPRMRRGTRPRRDRSVLRWSLRCDLCPAPRSVDLRKRRATASTRGSITTRAA